MKIKIPEESIEALRKYLLDNLGLNYPVKNEKDIIRNLHNAAVEFGYSDSNLFIKWLLETPLSQEQLSILSASFTIGETYFFREKKSFDFLEHIYLPELISRKSKSSKTIRIWSAGCASGEEAYSIAILLRQIIPDIKTWNISILATDINPVFLNKAEKGVYSEWSFRTNPGWLIEKYFTKLLKNKYQIIPEIRQMVKFSVLNLAENSFHLKNNTKNIDIIFCRNVMIYFSAKGIMQITSNFYKSLVNKGLLIVSPVEMTKLIHPQFVKNFYSGFTFYQKSIETAKNTDIEFPKKPDKMANTTLIKQLKEHSDSMFVDENVTVLKPKLTPVPKSNPELKFEEVKVLFNKGLYTEVEHHLYELLKISNGHELDILTLAVRTKANLGKFNEAETLCESAISKNKTDFMLYYLRAVVLQNSGKEEEAANSLKNALYLNHNFVLAHFLLGNIRIKSGKIMEGNKHLNNAMNILLKQSPDDLIPESEGLSVKNFIEIINTIRK